MVLHVWDTDTAALQALLDAAAAATIIGTGSTAAYLPVGRYLIRKSLVVKDGVSLEGSGYGSEIIMAPGCVGAGLRVQGSSAAGDDGSADHGRMHDESDGSASSRGRSRPRGISLTNLAVTSKPSLSNISQPIHITGKGIGTVFMHNVLVDSNG